MKQQTRNLTCILCLQSPPIKNSHIIPKFVIRWLKANSAVRHLRWSIQPNRPQQDAWTADYLCGGCEGRLSEVENRFKHEVFDHAVTRLPGRFSFGPAVGAAVVSMFFRHLRFTEDVRGEAPSRSLIDSLRGQLSTALDGKSDWLPIYMVPLAFEHGRTQGRVRRAPGYNQYVIALDAYWFNYHLGHEVFWIGAIKLPFLQLVLSQLPLDDLALREEDRIALRNCQIKKTGEFVVPSSCDLIAALLQSTYDHRSQQLRESVSGLSPRQQQHVRDAVQNHPGPHSTLSHEAAVADDLLATG